MHIDNEYEKLVKEGYIESGTLMVYVDDITKLELTSEEVKSYEVSQQARQDKGVAVIDKQGRVKKVSSLMFGYNKNNVKLADGNYANADDLLSAMKEAVTRLDSGTIVLNKKGETLNPEQLIKVVEEASGKIKIGDRSAKITNQDSRYWSVVGANSEIEHKKGVVLLGNNGIDLKSGEYVSIDELQTALNEYMVMSPKVEEVVSLMTESKVLGRVTRKYKNKLARWLIISAALVTFGSGFRLKDNVNTIEVPVEVQKQIVKIIEQDQLSYDIAGIDSKLTYETIEQAQMRIASGFKIGDEVKLEDGDRLYSNSELNGSSTIIGQGIRKADNYQLSGISVVYNGKVFAAHVDPSIENVGFEVGSFIEGICKQNNLDLNQVEVRLHFGNDANYTRTGWIDISKLIKADTIEQEVISKTVVEASNYDGIIDNFSGTSITFETLNGPVSINVIDNTGNLLKPGSITLGSDGKEYKISDLSITTTETKTIETILEQGIEYKQVIDGKKLTWKVEDCNLALAVAPLLGALASTIATKKKNEELNEQPILMEFKNEEEYLEFKKEFEQAKENYEKTTGFKRMVKNFFYRKEVNFLQRFTKEQIEQVYSLIRNSRSMEYTYSPDDKIEFKNGRVIITTKDNITKDITNIIIGELAKIGKDNSGVEGLLKGEKEDESYTR